MAVVGMDVQEVRNLATQLNSKADEIDSIANSLSNQLNSVQWIGTDADNFRHDWQSSYASQLRNICSALRDASSRATSNANQQEQTSAT